MSTEDGVIGGGVSINVGETEPGAGVTFVGFFENVRRNRGGGQLTSKEAI